ncbi:MAG: hypothetical protein HS116_26355 [Planctomycetes bacterium]|nr:hypothetical protein [Planctomycetota bacterium]
MGSHAYWYFVPYQPDLEAALHALRWREFKAGRYSPAMPDIQDLFPLGPHSPKPGPKHANIFEAQEAAEECGTGSILDITSIGTAARKPRDRSLRGQEDTLAHLYTATVAAPVAEEDLLRYFGTTQPTRKQVEGTQDYFELLYRGQALYIVVFDEGEPAQIFFAGRSFD